MGAQWKQAGRELAAQKKGQLVAKLVREIMVAAKLGDPDPALNARLFAAVEKARKASVTRDTIERAIKKGSGQTDEKIEFETVVYEGFAPHKVPVVVECLTDNRNRRLKTERHRCSRLVITQLVKEGIGTLVIGKNEAWKQAVSLGTRNNQNFVSIPHAQFIDLLTYKAHLLGIRVILTQESHTSKCSFLDLEPVGHHDVYLGKRLKRASFQAANGRIIHTDLNASYNILRKVTPDAFAKGTGAAVVQPVRVYPRANVKAML